ncbi:MAG: C-terminal binding protein [Alicyclobacillus sp.]|nr:C-terminal binding protein [Alicyclobacillus sp.]
MQPVIAITDHIFPTDEAEREAAQMLNAQLIMGQCHNEAEVLSLVRDADAILTTFAPVTERVVSQLTRCRVIARYGVGVDNVAVDTATQRGIYVCNVPDYCVDEVSDHALAMLLALARRLPQLNRSVREGQWDYRPFRPFYRLRGRVLGLIGYGRIARAVAHKARAFGMQIVVYDPYLPTLQESDVQLVEFEQLLRVSDFVSVHCPLTPETRGLIGREALRQMQPHAILINVARGGIVDELALAEALAAGRLGGAGLDVLTTEPIDSQHPLLQLDQVLITPHTAFYSEESTVDLQQRAVEEVVRVLSGQPPRSPVNRPVCSHSS